MSGRAIDLSFTKVQSLGNDFVLVRLEDVDQTSLPEIAVKTSDRRRSVGSDGLLALGASNGRLVLSMFNTDGTEDFCGNGIRCAALYAFTKGISGREAVICHGGESILTEIFEDGLVRSHFPAASFNPPDVPIAADQELFFRSIDLAEGSVTATALTTGSTHTVLFVDRLPSDHEVGRVGPQIENHPLFPNRTSVIWARPSGDQLEIRIWERGVGETLGCGTGSSAAAIAYRRAIKEGQLVGDPQTQTLKSIYVKNPGGPVTVYMAAWDAPIITSAVAELLYTGRIRLA